MIELDLLTTHADRAYPILAGLVTPRPIAWVTTLNEDGSVNAAPFSFFNVFGAEPPLVIFPSIVGPLSKWSDCESDGSVFTSSAHTVRRFERPKVSRK